jgi:hypothetical protein
VRTFALYRSRERAFEGEQQVLVRLLIWKQLHGRRLFQRDRQGDLQRAVEHWIESGVEEISEDDGILSGQGGGLAFLNCAPKPAALLIKASLLHRIDRVPHQSFEALDFSLPLSNGRILTRPLAKQRP